MPFFRNLPTLTSSWPTTATTASSFYTRLGVGYTTAAAMTAATATGSMYGFPSCDVLVWTGTTTAVTAINGSSNFWGLVNDEHEARMLHTLEAETRQQRPWRSPAIIRRRTEVAERYAREMAERDAANVLDQRHAAIQSHSAEAKRRARELLLEHLTPAQRETFRTNLWFIVEGRRSGQRYRIHAKGSLAANVDVLRSEPTGPEVSHRLCAHCELGTIPLGDQLLAQKLMLEFDEDHFLRIANRHAA